MFDELPPSLDDKANHLARRLTDLEKKIDNLTMLCWALLAICMLTGWKVNGTWDHHWLVEWFK